jgi:hypothetical protein
MGPKWAFMVLYPTSSHLKRDTSGVAESLSRGKMPFEKEKNGALKGTTGGARDP